MSNPTLSELMEAEKTTAEAVNKLEQSRWSSRKEIEEAEEAADAAYAAVVDALYGD